MLMYQCTIGKMFSVLLLISISTFAGAKCPCAVLKTYCDYSPGPCPKANICHGTTTECSCEDCPGVPKGECQNCTAPPTPPEPKRCYGDSDCPNGWCPVGPYDGPDDVINCTSTPPPSGCTSYTVLNPGSENDCLYACATPGSQPGEPGANHPTCSSASCAFLDHSGPSLPYRVNDLLYLAENCVEGGKIDPVTTGRCSICG